MIHALLFITNNNTDRGSNINPFILSNNISQSLLNSDGHGPEFLKEAKRISDAANLNITVYHS